MDKEKRYNTCNIVWGKYLNGCFLAVVENTSPSGQTLAEQTGAEPRIGTANKRRECGISGEVSRRPECADCPAWCCVDPFDDFPALPPVTRRLPNA